MRWHPTFGEVKVRESVWRLPAPAESYHRPFAGRIGVTARGCSRRLARAAADFGCEQSFARASAQLYEHYQVRLSASSLREATLRQARAIAARAAGPGPVRALPARGKAKVILAQADGTMLPLVTPQATAESRDWRKRRPVGWQEARLAVAQAKGSTRAHYGANLEGGVEEQQLDYAAARAAELPIGSGLIEAAHRHVLHARLKVSGAWWRRENAGAMIQARVCRANGQWATS